MAVLTDVFAALDDVATALDRLRVELDGCDDATVALSLGRLAGLRTRLDAVWLQAVGRAADRGLRPPGYRDTATWVASLAGERRGTARRDVDLAVQLTESPLVVEAMTSGELSRAKAAELLQASDLPADVQATLLDQARSVSVEQVTLAVHQARLAHGTEPAPVTPHLTVTRQADRALVDATLDLVDAEILDVALATAVEAFDLPTTMPYPERRARALTAIARYFLDHQTTVTGRVGRPHLLVLVDLDVLEARTGGTALVGSGAVISGDDARRLAEDANISRIITRGRSEPLDVGRTTRSIPPAIAKAVIARDRHCRYESCTSPIWACDIHHQTPWANGGATVVANLGLLCWYHHQHIHRHGPHHLHTTPDGRWTLARTEMQVA